MYFCKAISLQQRDMKDASLAKNEPSLVVVKKIGNKKRQIKYRTATTTYPCFFPDLGDSIGAGRTDLPV